MGLDMYLYEEKYLCQSGSLAERHHEYAKEKVKYPIDIVEKPCTVEELKKTVGRVSGFNIRALSFHCIRGLLGKNYNRVWAFTPSFGTPARS